MVAIKSVLCLCMESQWSCLLVKYWSFHQCAPMCYFAKDCLNIVLLVHCFCLVVVVVDFSCGDLSNGINNSHSSEFISATKLECCDRPGFSLVGFQIHQTQHSPSLEPQQETLRPPYLYLQPSFLHPRYHAQSFPSPLRSCGRHSRKICVKTECLSVCGERGCGQQYYHLVQHPGGPHLSCDQLISAGFQKQLLEYFHYDPLSGHLGRHKT